LLVLLPFLHPVATTTSGEITLHPLEGALLVQTDQSLSLTRADGTLAPLGPLPTEWAAPEWLNFLGRWPEDAYLVVRHKTHCGNAQRGLDQQPREVYRWEGTRWTRDEAHSVVGAFHDLGAGRFTLPGQPLDEPSLQALCGARPARLSALQEAGGARVAELWCGNEPRYAVSYGLGPFEPLALPEVAYLTLEGMAALPDGERWLALGGDGQSSCLLRGNSCEAEHARQSGSPYLLAGLGWTSWGGSLLAVAHLSSRENLRLLRRQAPGLWEELPVPLEWDVRQATAQDDRLWVVVRQPGSPERWSLLTSP
jgi:hypothetical protein